MPIDVMVKEATGLPDKYVDMVVSYIRFLQYQLKSEETVHSSGKRKLGIKQSIGKIDIDASAVDMENACIRMDIGILPTDHKRQHYPTV